MELVFAVYEHAALLVDATPWEVSRDEDLLFTAHMTACQVYEHAPVVVGVDVYNLEAEAYGAVVARPVPPGVPHLAGALCADLRQVMALRPFDAGAGRLPMTLQTAHRLVTRLPQAQIRVPVSGPVSLLANLMGAEALLMAAMDDATGVARALAHLLSGQLAWCGEISRQGLQPIVFESAASPPLFSPGLYRQLVAPVLREMLGEIHRTFGTPATLIIGGDMAEVADSLCELAVDAVICPAETDQARFLEVLRRSPEVRVRVNMRPGTIAAAWDIARAEIDRVAALARTRPNTSIGTGVIPYGTRPTVLLRAREYVATLS